MSRSAIVLPSTCAPARLPGRAGPPRAPLSAGSGARRCRERGPSHVVDHLRVDVRHAPKHTEARTLGRAGNAFSLPQHDAVTAIFLGVDLHNRVSSSQTVASKPVASRWTTGDWLLVTTSLPSFPPSSSTLRRCSGHPSACRDPARGGDGCSPPPARPADDRYRSR